MFEDLVLVAPLDPNAVVKALEHVPAAAGDASRALASAMAGVRGNAMSTLTLDESKQAGSECGSTLGAMQEGSWLEWAPLPHADSDAQNLLGQEMKNVMDSANRCPISRPNSSDNANDNLIASQILPGLPPPERDGTARISPAAIRIQPANGWDQIVSHRAGSNDTLKISNKVWSFGDGTVSLWELVTGINFQVYMGIHMWAVVAIVNWRSWRLAALCALMYILKMFGITGGFHRLLSHRSYKTSRVGQFVMAWLGCSAFQKGPLWWCSHHRHHHRTADTPDDAHSPVQSGFWWSHIGWFLCSTHHVEARMEAVPDLVRLPELRWLDKYHYIPPVLLAFALYRFGGWAAVGWGFMLSNVLCWHATYCINSVAHLIGSRRYSCEFQTHCDARNNLWLALATLGEGWHNNHHCYMRSSKHGFYAGEVDVTYAVLRALAGLGLVWDLELPPLQELEKKRLGRDRYECRCKKVEEDLQQIERE